MMSEQSCYAGSFQVELSESGFRKITQMSRESVINCSVYPLKKCVITGLI